MIRRGPGFRLVFGAVLLALVVLPPFLGSYQRLLLTEMLVWGLFAMAFDLIYGYVGMLGFGQALFFGVGAYGVAIPLLAWDAGLWLALLFAVALSAAFAWGTGFLAVRVSGAYFVIITIIFSLIFYYLAMDWKGLTGGETGLTFPAPALPGLGLSLTNPVVNYYFVLAVALLAYLLTQGLVDSPLGVAFRTIRENEERAMFIGYRVERVKLIAYVISGALAGAGGALYALTARYANVDFLLWTISGDAVIWTLVGGAGTLVGPFLGAGFLIVFSDYLSAWFKNYPIVVGLLLIAVVLTAPQGIMGFLGRGGKGERG